MLPELADVLLKCRSDIMLAGPPQTHLHHLRCEPVGALGIAVDFQHVPASIKDRVNHPRLPRNTATRITATILLYPILDEEDYSRRESESTIDNIVDAAWRIKDDYELPDDWEYEAYGWLSDNDCGAIENSDDQGGYPSEESLRAALDALGFEQVEAVC